MRNLYVILFAFLLFSSCKKADHKHFDSHFAVYKKFSDALYSPENTAKKCFSEISIQHFSEFDELFNSGHPFLRLVKIDSRPDGSASYLADVYFNFDKHPSERLLIKIEKMNGNFKITNIVK